MPELELRIKQREDEGVPWNIHSPTVIGRGGLSTARTDPLSSRVPQHVRALEVVRESRNGRWRGHNKDTASRMERPWTGAARRLLTVTKKASLDKCLLPVCAFFFFLHKWAWQMPAKDRYPCTIWLCCISIWEIKVVHLINKSPGHGWRTDQSTITDQLWMTNCSDNHHLKSLLYGQLYITLASYCTGEEHGRTNVHI